MIFRVFSLLMLMMLPNVANAGLIKVDVTFMTSFYEPIPGNENPPISDVNGSFSFLMDDPKNNPEFFKFYWENKKLSSINLNINGLDFSPENTEISITTYANKLHKIFVGGIVGPYDSHAAITQGTNDFWFILGTGWTKDITTDATGYLWYQTSTVDNIFESNSFHYTLTYTQVPEPHTLVLFLPAMALVLRKYRKNKT